MHLVIRETHAPPPPSRTSPSRRSPAAPHARPPAAGAYVGAQYRSSSLNANPPTSGIPHPPGHQHGSSPDLLSLMQNRNQRVVEAYARAREERNRGEGVHGSSTPNNGRGSPALHHYRDPAGPTRQTYRVETTIRTGQPQTQADGSLSPVDVHTMLRNADMAQATAAMTNAMHRSASGASLHSMYNRPVNQPANMMPTNYGGRATPDLSARSASGGSNVGQAPASSSRPAVDVYILSSPEGPRALLVNNGTSETYYSPRLPMQSSYSRLREAATHVATPGTPAQSPAQNLPQHNQENLQPQGQQPPVQAQLQDGLNDRDNPQPPVLPPLLIQMWPHIWLLFRLGVFVWFFTSPNSPWSRWLSVLGLAIGIFVYQVGALNHIAGFAWQPVRQHLQGLLPPMEGQPQRAREGENANPAEMAARLIAQRERENWLQGQIRRIERAGLLFLASIAPGFAEEHIQNLEREARQERERIEAEAEAARRQQEEREQQEASTNETGESNDVGNTEQAPGEDTTDRQNGEDQTPQSNAVAA